MNFEKLTSDNFLIYATKMYDTNQCTSIDDFNSDLRRFSSVKRLLLRRARDAESINLRMLLNHVIIISNLFGNTAASKLLFFYCPAKTHSMLKAILLFLNILPPSLEETNLCAYAADAELINTLKDI